MAFFARVPQTPATELDQNQGSVPPVSEHTVLSTEEGQNGDSDALRERPQETGQGQLQAEQYGLLRGATPERDSPHQPSKKHPDTFNIPQNSQPVKRYSIWPVPVTMFGLVLLGFAIAIGHHLCYNYLDGKPVTKYSQAWILRLATGAAFIVKVMFTVAVSTALSQVTWFTLRRRYFKIGVVDKMFTSQSDPLSFFSRELLTAAPLTLTMAALTWALGVIAVLAPSTLSVSFITQSSGKQCQVPVFGAGSVSSLTVWQQQPGGNRTPYGGPSLMMLKIAERTMMGAPAEFPPPCGQNCSYSISFLGPAMGCDYQSVDLAKAVLGKDALLDNKNGATFSYYVSVRDTQHQGMLWVQYVEHLDYNERPAILLCATFNATYNVDVNFRLGRPSFNTTISNLTKAEIVNWGNGFHVFACL
jgi:hypothetical protein